MPAEAALVAYNSSYFASAHGGQPADKVAVAFFSAMAKLRLEYIKKYLAKHEVPIGTVLEFGPGPGFFAGSWLGWRGSDDYFAIETDQSCHEPLRRIGVKLVDAQAAVPVDLVVMSHVLEHVPAPGAFVRNATSKLKSGGALFLEVPCRDWAHKHLDEPHILFFEKPPMRKLLDEQGFVDIEMGYFGQTIEQLQTISPLQTRWNALRAKIIGRGLVAPFARLRPGMEPLTDPLERAIVAPYRAHEESEEPAWWLRVVARKA